MSSMTTKEASKDGCGGM